MLQCFLAFSGRRGRGGTCNDKKVVRENQLDIKEKATEYIRGETRHERRLWIEITVGLL